MTVLELQRTAAAELPRSPTPRLDCDCLLGFLLNKSRSWLAAHNDEVLTPEQEAKYYSMTASRRTGLPIAYITGHKEFFGLDFIVTQDVLIPKPDTELIVEQALIAASELTSQPDIRNNTIQIADICTGSGCIAISILHELPHHITAVMTAADISQAALTVAQSNANILLPQHTINFICGNLLYWNTESHTSISPKQRFNLIVSNPPYVPSDTVTELLADGRSEPRLALDGGHAGLDIIKDLIPQVFISLTHGGCFLIETGEYNAAATAELLSKAGFIDIVNYTDMGGMPRVTRAKKP